MIRSMTGFGRSEYVKDGLIVSVEVRSVNGRFFDLKSKLPKSLNCCEGELRKIAQNFIERGRVTVTINLDSSSILAQEITVNYDIADRYIHMSKEMSSRYGIDSNIDACTLLSLSEIIQWNENGSDPDILWNVVKKAVVKAFEANTAMRETEGASIGKDIRTRVNTIQSIIEEVEKCAPEIIKVNTTRLRKKIASLISDSAIDESRFLMEIALYADRVDITEECVRLKSHCDQFTQEISCDKTSGRKLSFLLQEMNREVNTIGSKVMDINISRSVIRIKEELEKMREQTENME